MSKFKVGQEVVIHIPRLGRGATREFPGKVVKVAKKYGTAEWTDGERTRTVEFSLTDGRERGSASNYTTRVLTLEEQDLGLRKSAVSTALMEAKISLQFGHSYTLEQQEAILALLRSFSEPDATP